MTLLINPGSGPIREGEGWTNTLAQARQYAQAWLDQMRAEGIVDVVLAPEVEECDGRWRFTFVHTVTGAGIVLETHGIDNMAAYMGPNIFGARTYWNGSSCSNPCLDDWGRPGFEPVQTYRAVEATS